jgi:hypothetical protein
MAGRRELLGQTLRALQRFGVLFTIYLPRFSIHLLVQLQRLSAMPVSTATIC